jgi:hypothetical protein
VLALHPVLISTTHTSARRLDQREACDDCEQKDATRSKSVPSVTVNVATLRHDFVPEEPHSIG